jgi:protein-S-isoprenylcysteine O-methyltransferase Ste14
MGALLIYGVERTLETFWKRKTIPGLVIAPYTLYLLIVAHVMIFLVALHDGMKQNLLTLSTANVVGLSLVAIATMGRLYSIRALAGYHSIQIEIRKNHPLINQGPYRLIRNPYYLSNAVEVVGFPLIVNSLVGATLGVLLYWPCLYLRIVLEERALLQEIKTPFAEYMLRVPRFVPLPIRGGGRI